MMNALGGARVTGLTRRRVLEALSTTGMTGAASAMAACGVGAGTSGAAPAAKLDKTAALYWLNWANNVATQEADTQLIKSFQAKYHQFTVEDGRTPPDKPYNDKLAAL